MDSLGSTCREKNSEAHEDSQMVALTPTIDYVVKRRAIGDLLQDGSESIDSSLGGSGIWKAKTSAPINLEDHADAVCPIVSVDDPPSNLIRESQQVLILNLDGWKAVGQTGDLSNMTHRSVGIPGKAP
jgi:hypothetical protein